MGLSTTLGLIYGTAKPQPQHALNAADDSTPIDETVGTLTVEMLDLIFQRKIPTTVSIPPPCRLQFSRALKSSLDNVIAKPLDLYAWLNLLLLPVCTLNLYMPKNSSEERSGVRKKLQIVSINEALATWKEPYGCYSLVQKVLELSKPNHHQQKQSVRKVKDVNLEAFRRKLSSGLYTAAILVLSSDGVAPSTPDKLHELQLKHPSAAPPVIPADNPSSNALCVDSKSVLQALKSFPKGTACARDGLRAQHFLDALSGAAASVAEDLLHSIVGVVNLWMEGRCPAILSEFVASAPLTPLLNPGGGLRPIAVGTIWRRLCSKLAATLVCKYLTTYLGNHHFGVGIPCGGEAILHSANKLV
ncbi:uncharacterized protein LOC113287447 [Papaver somniferum]|uniref:uncharacterized protein LOC113287447 n=1 Tax=Papaver somniferum TaxID=3469 RepID=UPI000E701ED2|nr:uncharacterized protein LOC113287447 [Papaver somniferum]XP_026391996.1 uncharacterized protein LOC113287447 [Papaver somniferum]